MILENPLSGFLICVTAGWFLGLLTGMIPGIHVNNIAVILAGTAAFFCAAGLSPVLLSAVILSCAVSHTFHNIIPAIFLGAPGEETVFAVLPGHKLLIAGYGLPAVKISAFGSAAAVFFSFMMIFPAAWILSAYYSILEPQMGWILVILSLLLLFSEKKPSKIILAGIVFLTAGFLGWIAFEMDGSLNPVIFMSSASVLMPLLSGLFGVPQLILSLFSKSELYEAPDAEISFPQKLFVQNAFLGTAAGAFVSWIPGVSSSVAAVLAGFFKKDSRLKSGHSFDGSGENGGADFDTEITHAQEYIVIVSAINTANAIFGLMAFFAIGKSRNGAVISIRDILSDSGYPLTGSFSGEMIELFLFFYAVIIFSALLSCFSTIHAGRIVPRLLQYVDYRKISVLILLLLSILIFILCGSYGFVLFAAAVLIGFLPVVLHVKKSNLMGVILFPVMLYFLGLR